MTWFAHWKRNAVKKWELVWLVSLRWADLTSCSRHRSGSLLCDDLQSVVSYSSLYRSLWTQRSPRKHWRFRGLSIEFKAKETFRYESERARMNSAIFWQFSELESTYDSSFAIQEDCYRGPLQPRGTNDEVVRCCVDRNPSVRRYTFVIQKNRQLTKGSQ